jgi:hypothetical protein
VLVSERAVCMLAELIGVALFAEPTCAAAWVSASVPQPLVQQSVLLLSCPGLSLAAHLSLQAGSLAIGSIKGLELAS